MSPNGSGIGVLGESLVGEGVSGISDTGIGVWGHSNSNTGTGGISEKGIGVHGISTTGPAGVRGDCEKGVGLCEFGNRSRRRSQFPLKGWMLLAQQ